MTGPTSRQRGRPTETRQQFQTTTLGQKVISGHKSQSGLDALTYWLTVSCNVTST
jgi:hypothetical protein